MPGLQPPTPKERPVVLAGSPPPPPPVTGARTPDDYGAIAFIVLVVLGLVAASRAFMLLGV